MGILEDISSLITTETNKYIGDCPDTPDKLIVLYRTGGFDGIMDLNKNNIERPTIMIKLRDTSYTSAESRCIAIINALDSVTNTVINGTTYVEIFQVGDINPLGKDSRERWEFTINFKISLIK